MLAPNSATSSSATNSRRIEIPALTGLRGVAALWVLLFHAWQTAGAPAWTLLGVPLSALLGCGWMGVDLFFVLSGYLLGAPFALARIEQRPQPALAGFWKRRIGRVIPAYWGQVLILAALAWWSSGQWPMTWLQTLAQFSLTENLLPVFNEPLNPVHWSLPVEWDFYILLPLLALPWGRIKGWQLLLLAIVFGVAWRYACVAVFQHWQADGVRFYTTVLQLPSRIDEFFAGMLAGVLASRLRSHWAAGLAALGAVLVLGLAFAIHGVGDFISHVKLPWVYLVYSVLALGFGLLVLGASRGGSWSRWLFANRPLRAAGIISYSLYLWHYPIMLWLHQAGWIGRDQGTLQTLALTFSASVLVATLSWRLLERPFHTPPRPVHAVQTQD